jgi:hypothetical protein
MAEALKVLGQADPAATTLTPLYTVPGSTSVTVSTLAICNRNSSNVDVRASVAVGGASDDPKQYIFYDLQVGGNDSVFATLGITLGAADVVRVYASTTGVSFSLFGVEVS